MVTWRVFNCQSAGWCKETKNNRIHDTSPGTLTGLVRADDAGGDSIVYAYRSGRLPKDVSIPLKVLEYERFHISPLKTPRHVQLKWVYRFYGYQYRDRQETGAFRQRQVSPSSGSGTVSSQALSFPTALISLSVRGCGLSIR
ncbi:hypothetical protein HID58_026536 [Brassica napus]|uniref:Uncharacterized protein n=1 Tax=Brassica napus TaxID=3708 RepID=A0ABQ8CRE2_BRANA|nr:hypothetical protein HID58_026536 [Brassica napus]